jgi:hypothetical protein
MTGLWFVTHGMFLNFNIILELVYSCTFIGSFVVVHIILLP